MDNVQTHDRPKRYFLVVSSHLRLPLVACDLAKDFPEANKKQKELLLLADKSKPIYHQVKKDIEKAKMEKGLNLGSKEETTVLAISAVSEVELKSFLNHAWIFCKWNERQSIRNSTRSKSNVGKTTCRELSQSEINLCYEKLPMLLKIMQEKGHITDKEFIEAGFPPMPESTKNGYNGQRLWIMIIKWG